MRYDRAWLREVEDELDKLGLLDKAVKSPRSQRGIWGFEPPTARLQKDEAMTDIQLPEELWENRNVSGVAWLKPFLTWRMGGAQGYKMVEINPRHIALIEEPMMMDCSIRVTSGSMMRAVTTDITTFWHPSLRVHLIGVPDVLYILRPKPLEKAPEPDEDMTAVLLDWRTAFLVTCQS